MQRQDIVGNPQRIIHCLDRQLIVQINELQAIDGDTVPDLQLGLSLDFPLIKKNAVGAGVLDPPLLPPPA